jgi:hypothetical protein
VKTKKTNALKALSGVSRRVVYRRCKQLLIRLLLGRRLVPQFAAESAVRRFLRDRPRSELARLVGDRAFALAAVAALVAAGSAGAIPPIDLDEVAHGNGGFAAHGSDASGYAGWSVSGGADVNGDGLDDFIVGAPFVDEGGASNAGRSYVVFGKLGGQPVDLAEVAAGNGGFAINGTNTYDYSGYSVSCAGDVNGDGLDDVIVGAPWSSPGGNSYSGTTFVVFGKADTTPVDLADVAAGNGGFAINGAATYDTSGHSVSGAGDVNGDGLEDVVVGARLASPGGNAYAGASYVVFGKADGTPVDLADVIDGAGGFAMNGIAPYDQAGFSVSDTGDVDGDGLDDLVVGAPFASPSGRVYAGESYVVFGKADGAAVDLADVAAGIGGYKLEGIDGGDNAGFSVSGAGDVNHDGLGDVVVGARFADPLNRTNAGETYVVFGQARGTPVDLADVAAGSGGFMITGAASTDQSGYSVSGAGDVNGDGLDDVVIGANLADPYEMLHAGQSYVVFGKMDGDPVHLHGIPATGGFALNGAGPTEQSGFCVSGAGDVNGDGRADIIVGAPFADAQDLDAGTTYMVLNPIVNGDLDGDGSVTTADFLILLSSFGPCPEPCPPMCPADLSGDCLVNTADLLIMLSLLNGDEPQPQGRRVPSG